MARLPFIFKETSIAPLVIFRVIFGSLMAFSVARFALKGWIEEVYIAPQFHFSYYGFEWVKVLPPHLMYSLFAVMFIAAIFITLGLFYRVASVLFFLAFTYVELIDKANYLNHYYFVSLIAFLMIWLPAHRRFSLDVRLFRLNPTSITPAWTINILKFQLFVVYFYAGIAKLNADWLLQAQPLKTWLPASSHLPIIGSLMTYEATAYVFSWAGALYDICIPFLLINTKTRPFAFGAVVIFHGLTAALFPIGMFPYIMTLSALIFFSASFHERILRALEKIFRAPTYLTNYSIRTSLAQVSFIVVFCLFQLAFPWRYLFYPGNLFWTEEGYRFSWRVMLIEKMGSATFTVTDPKSRKTAIISNSDYLSPLQEREMSTQPDMILQFAHFLAEEYQNRGFDYPEVKVKSMVTLNGQRSKPFIDSSVNLAAQEEGWEHKDWILPYRN